MAKTLGCWLGRHDWKHHRNPEMGGSLADFQVCARCGKERNVFEKKDGTGIGGVGAG